MEGFVRRVASPHNAQPASNTSRQAIALNAKVTAEDRKAALRPQTQAGVPSRGVSNTQNSSATRQVPQLYESVHGHGATHDVYDTDAESLDTTANASIFRDKNNQAASFQHENRGLIENRGESTDDEEEDVEEEGGNDHDEAEEVEFTQEQVDFIANNGFGHYPFDKKVEILQKLGASRGFQTVDGDSYPSTTDGQPTHWDTDPEPSDEPAYGQRVSSPNLAVTNQVLHPIAQQSLQHGPENALGSGYVRHTSAQIYQHGAELRDQKRNQRIVYNLQPHPGSLSLSQMPAYSQANIGSTSAVPLHSHDRPAPHIQTKHSAQPLRKNPTSHPHVQFENMKTMKPAMSSNGPLAGPFQTPHTTLQQSFEHISAGEFTPRPDEDYNRAELFSMSYDALKNESFDLDPRAEPQVLGDEVLQKQFTERLEFVQKNLDTERQSSFFCSLSTAEWENAGDWFLDEFQKIIQRTKEIRQNKRKLAQGFEEEIEKRYRHVSKKQEKVGAAMNKMKQQGEGLVPRSPRLSKSPAPEKH